VLVHALEDQQDEGQAKYFDIYIIESRSTGRLLEASRASRSWLTPSWPTRASWIYRGLVDCKLTKSGREIPEKGSVVSQREFKFSRRLPR